MQKHPEKLIALPSLLIKLYIEIFETWSNHNSCLCIYNVNHLQLDSTWCPTNKARVVKECQGFKKQIEA